MARTRKIIPVLGAVSGEKKASDERAELHVPRRTRQKESAGLFNMVALDELTKSMDRAMASVRKIAEASTVIRPLLDKMAAFESWAQTMPGSEKPRQSPTPPSEQRTDLPFEWEPPNGYEAIANLPADIMQKLIGTAKGQMECVKYGRDAAGQFFQEVARIRIDNGEEFFYRPEPPGNVQGTFWVRPDMAVRIQAMQSPPQ